MLYKVVGGATVLIASLSILTQIILLPYLFSHTDNLKAVFKQRIQRFNAYAQQFDSQSARLQQLGRRPKRQLDVIRERCPPPYPGPAGPEGEAGPDGNEGEPGRDGPRGLDAQTQLEELFNQCITCPPGPHGHPGAPGPPGFEGVVGDRGDPGIPGLDGTDGDQGPEGDEGFPGLPGKNGKPGSAGIPAPGGTGPPGEKGAPGADGASGPQGKRGLRSYVIGAPGGEGKAGTPGYDGQEGKPGLRGEKGEPGEPGAPARFCPCPVELSLIQHKGTKTTTTTKKGSSHLAANDKQPLPSDAKAIAFAAPRFEVSKPLDLIDGGISHISSDSLKSLDSDTFVADAFPHPKATSLPGSSSKSKVKNIAYDDAYPENNGLKKVDYDDAAEGLASTHEGENGDKKPKLHDGGYDDSVPLAATLSPQLDANPEHQFVEENVNNNNPEVAQSQDTEVVTEEPYVTEEPEEPYEELTTRRRILYVTKRPRLGIVQN